MHNPNATFHCTRPLTRRAPALSPVCLLTALLTACGGGGEAPATGADTPRQALAAAPVLPRGAEPAPPLAYRCGNVALGALRSGEIEVPAGQVCVLQGTRVEGNIKLNAGSVLDARDVTVVGNLQGDGAASVLLAGASSLTGSVQLKQGGGATLLGARIGGDIQVDDHFATLFAQGNQVGGNIQVIGNRGGVTLVDNRIVGNLQCKDNLPAPRGSGNLAASSEDQCNAMQPASGTAPGEPLNPPVAPLPPLAQPTLPAAAAAAGSNVVCRDLSLDAQTYANVSVPSGARCELIGTRLTGNLELAAGASADVRDARVNGNLQADGPAVLRVSGGRFDGSVQVDRGETTTLNGAVIGGALQLKTHTGLLWLQGLQVGADLQLFDNRGGATLNANTVGGNLQCKGNVPAPAGTGNRAASKEDQCQSL